MKILARLISIIIGILFFAVLPTQASLLNISQSPLFVSSSVHPNVTFLVDDSGSMDWEILTKPHWIACSYDPDSNPNDTNESWDCAYYATDGLLYTRNGWYISDVIAYLFQTSDSAYPNNCSGSAWYSMSLDCANREDWRAFSSDLNVMAYNPDDTYSPWPGPCSTNGTTCSNASFTSARSNPREGESGYSVIDSLAGHRYEVWIDDKGFSGSYPRRGYNRNNTNTANNIVDLWDSHITITLNSSNAITVTKTTYTPTNTSMGASTSTLATLTNTQLCYNILGTSDLVDSINAGSLSATSTDANGCRTITQTVQNYANWYQYSRKRSFATKSAISQVINQTNDIRYALTVINNDDDLFVEVPDASTTQFSAHNQSLLASLFGYNWPAAGTPLRNGLKTVGSYYSGTLSGKTNPIIQSCQQNFTVMLTDGFWNGNTPSGIGDSDGDGTSVTVADVARHYYSTDLSNLANNVPTNSFDNATHQHMVTFTVAFGVEGNLIDSDGDGWPNPTLAEDSYWGNPFSSNAAKIDDLWHAAFNSKGSFFAITTPSELASKITETLTNIQNRVGSGAAVAASSGSVATTTKVYQAQFDSGDWQGHLFSYGFGSDGNLNSTADWDAGCVLTGGTCATVSGSNPGIAADNRIIITARSDNGTGIAFRWPNDYTNPNSNELNSTQIAALLTGISSNQQTMGAQLVNYLRGDQSNEQQNGGSYRNRLNLLGDLINSSPVYVGAPALLYPESIATASYAAFKSANASRTPIVYVGGNDGMLHGFNASTGAEVIAFIPSTEGIYDHLYTLANTDYSHRYFVDGSASATDAVVNNAWKTVLGGGLNAGGQGLYLLNITDPTQFNESNADDIVLWEFDDSDDSDLGYTFAQPKIAKMNNGQWAMIVGNGYNNAESDNHIGSGKAALFVLFMDGGTDGTWTANTDYVKIVPSNDIGNGLSTAALADVDGDYDVDYIYAGDLQGNLWKFDVSDASSANWTSTLLFSAEANQAITSAPIVSAHPNGINQGVVVYFGTGKYLEPGDASAVGQTTQTFYAIWDKLDNSSVNRNQLLQQEIIASQTVDIDTNGDGTNDDTNVVRFVTNNQINWALQRGWYLDLYDPSVGNNQGERIISSPLIRDDRVIFTTLIPTGSICDAGGTSFIMEMTKAGGSRLQHNTPFDVNEDGVLDINDQVDAGNQPGYGDLNDNGSESSNSIYVSGIQSKVGVTPTPTVLMSEDKTTEVKVASGSTGIGTVLETTGDEALGRQSWRRLK